MAYTNDDSWAGGAMKPLTTAGEYGKKTV